MRISDWSSDVCSSDLWRSVGVEPGINGHLIVVMGIIGRRIGSKASGWPMFEALIDRQDDHLASTTQTAMHQHARQLALHNGIIALILIEHGFDGWRPGLAFPSFPKFLTGRARGCQTIVFAITG